MRFSVGTVASGSEAAYDLLMLVLCWFSVKMSLESQQSGEIPPYGRGFSRHEDLSL